MIFFGVAMRVLILGGSGFIGSAVVKALLLQNIAVRVSTRAFSRTGSTNSVDGLKRAHWNGSDGQALVALMDKVDVVINLLGENIGAHRWTKAQKNRIRQSRIIAGNAVTQAFLQCKATGNALPHTLIQASACGYYGVWDDFDQAPCCGEDANVGLGFLAETCVAWEASTAAVESLGVRRCILRTAPVLGPRGGMLSKMLPSFRACLGGTFGSGLQPVSWVHLDDAVAAILYLIQNTALQGPFNISSPQPVRMQDFVADLAKALHRPALLHIPAFMLKWTLGELAKELLLSGQKVVPARLQAEGFVFDYPQLDEAIAQILHS